MIACGTFHHVLVTGPTLGAPRVDVGDLGCPGATDSGPVGTHSELLGTDSGMGGTDPEPGWDRLEWTECWIARGQQGWDRGRCRRSDVPRSHTMRPRTPRRHHQDGERIRFGLMDVATGSQTASANGHVAVGGHGVGIGDCDIGRLRSPARSTSSASEAAKARCCITSSRWSSIAACRRGLSGCLASLPASRAVKA